MKRAIRPALIVFLVLLAIVYAVAESARSLYKKGKDAYKENRNDPDRQHSLPLLHSAQECSMQSLI